MASIPWEKLGDEDEELAMSESGDELSGDASMEDVEDDFDEAIDDAEVPARGAKRARIEGKHGNVNVLPSTEEMARLKETESAFKSSLFSLQVTELLKHAGVHYSKLSDLGNALREIKERLDSMVEVPINRKLVAKKYSSLKLHNPVDELAFSVFAPPSVNVIGSFLLKNQSASHPNVDVAVEISPKSLKDHDLKNGLYFDKRTILLAVIADRLKPLSFVDRTEIEALRGDPLKKVIVIYPKTGLRFSKWSIRIHPIIKQSAFKTARLLPEKSNEGLMKVASAQYNAAIVEDMMLDRHLQFLNSSFGNSENVQQTLLLFRIWMGNRGMLESADSVNVFLLSMLLAHFVQLRVIDTNMLPQQMFTVMLRILSDQGPSWVERGLFVSKSEDDEAYSKWDREVNEELRASYLASFPLVFVDASGLLNLFRGVSKSAFLDLVYEATLSLRLLESTLAQGLLAADKAEENSFLLNPHAHRDDAFNQVFLERSTPLAKYDALLRVNVVDRAELENIAAMLRRGYGDRMLLARGILAPKSGDESQIGLIFHPVNFKRLVDMGPAADDEAEVKKFRSLWGSKVEIRRFKDGKIIACAVWDAPSVEARHRIVMDIGSHLVSTHFPERPFSWLLDSDLDAMAAPHPKAFASLTSNQVPTWNSVSAHGLINEQWGLFSALVTAVSSSLPLQIRSAMPVSETFRFTDAYAQPPHPLLFPSPLVTKLPQAPLHVRSFDVVLTLEASSAWPLDFEAIKKVKAAFYLGLAKALLDRHGVHAHATHEYLDAYYGGVVFRLRIFVPREVLMVSDPSLAPEQLSLLEASGTAGADGSFVSKNPAVVLTATYRELVAAPQLASSLHALHLKCPSFGPTARLAKRWIDATMMSNHFSAEAIDLLVAGLFVNADLAPYSYPRQSQVGFVRFLRLLGSFDFHSNPYIVDFTGELTSEQHKEIRRSFENFANLRSSEPSSALPMPFIAYSGDLHHSIWTRGSPSPIALHRTVRLAQVALNYLQTTPTPDWKVLFAPSAKDFNVVLKLAPHIALSTLAQSSAGNHHSLTSKQRKAFKREVPAVIYKNDSRMHAVSKYLLVDFNPVARFCESLQDRLGDLAIVFSDFHPQSETSATIGLCWNPFKCADLDKFQLHRSLYLIPTESGFSVDRRGAIDEILEIGKGIVSEFHEATS